MESNHKVTKEQERGGADRAQLQLDTCLSWIWLFVFI